MELLYLGTSAAEGAPALFCECDFCKYARAVGGREIRTRSGSLLDGRLKLDFGPDSLKQMLDNGLDYTFLRSVLITHSHPDHLSPSDVACRRRGYAQMREDAPPLTGYGNERVGDLIAPYTGRDVEFVRMIPFEPRQIEGYTVTALEALHMVNESSGKYPVSFRGKVHTRDEEALIYLVEKDGESQLYAHDTGGLTDRNLEYLAGRRLTLVSLDTNDCSWNTGYIGHMSIERVKEAKQQLLAVGAADGSTVFVANHFSHNGLIPYEQIQQRLPGFLVSHDGMKVRTGGSLNG